MSMSSLLKVTTVKGVEAHRKDCRRIDDEYYIVGDIKIKDSGDVYQIGGRYYREDTGYIVFDERIKEYVIKNASIVHGIMDFVDGKPVMGYFSKNNLYGTKISLEEGTYEVLDASIIDKNRRFRLHLGRDTYYPIYHYTAKEFNEMPILDRQEKLRLPYNCDGVMETYKEGYAASTIVPSEQTEHYAKMLKDLTFGLEFETISGKVPSRVCDGLGLIPLRDGSISGLEYASIPYGGARGIEATRLACNALDRYTTYDDNCSLHLHIGGMPREKEFLVALFKTLCLLQDEMYSLFPLYKKYNFGVKQKNYTKMLPNAAFALFDRVIDKDNIDRNFDIIFKFLSMGISIDDYGGTLDKVDSHPSDPGGRSKWNIRSRYHWVNLIPIVFGNKKTVEFRIHTPTTDFNKVNAYLFICCGIINYVKDNCDKILKGDVPRSIEDVLYGVYSKEPSLLSNLSRYVSRRRDTTYSQNSQGNLKGDETEIKATDIFAKSSFSGYGSAPRPRRTTDFLESEPDKGYRGGYTPPPVPRGLRDAMRFGTVAGTVTRARAQEIVEEVMMDTPLESEDED